MSKGVPTMLRPASQAVSMSLYSVDCIDGLIKYIETKKKDNPTLRLGVYTKQPTTRENIVEVLIELLKQKGFPNLSMDKLNDLEILLSTGDTSRPSIYAQLIQWVQGGLLSTDVVAEDLRKSWTQEGTQLIGHAKASVMEIVANAKASVIAIGGSFYCADWNDKSCKTITIEPCNSQEQAYIYNLVYGTNNTIVTGIPPDFPSPQEESNIKCAKSYKEYYIANHKIPIICKKACGVCWLCGHTIYIYAIDDGGGNYIPLNKSCGDQEHTATPGVGNFMGLLFGDNDMQRDSIKKATLGMHGIKPSHSWCNKAKGDMDFILMSKRGYAPWWGGIPPNGTKHSEGLNDFKVEMIRWLTIKGVNKDNKRIYQQRWSWEPLFMKRNNGDPEIMKFVDHTIENIRIQVQAICDTANQTIVANSLGLLNTQVLCRLAFYGAIMVHDYVRKERKDLFDVVFKQWSKAGGKRKSKSRNRIVGGVDGDDNGMANADNLTNLVFGMHSSCDSPNLLDKIEPNDTGVRRVTNPRETIFGYLTSIGASEAQAEDIIYEFGLEDIDVPILDTISKKIRRTSVIPLMIEYISEAYDIQPPVVHKFFYTSQSIQEWASKITRMAELREQGRSNNEIHAEFGREKILDYLTGIGFTQRTSENVINVFNLLEADIPPQDISTIIGTTKGNNVLSYIISTKFKISRNLVHHYLESTASLQEFATIVQQIVALTRRGWTETQISHKLESDDADRYEHIHNFLERKGVPVEGILEYCSIFDLKNSDTVELKKFYNELKEKKIKGDEALPDITIEYSIIHYTRKFKPSDTVLVEELLKNLKFDEIKKILELYKTENEEKRLEKNRKAEESRLLALKSKESEARKDRAFLIAIAHSTQEKYRQQLAEEEKQRLMRQAMDAAMPEQKKWQQEYRKSRPELEATASNLKNSKTGWIASIGQASYNTLKRIRNTASKAGVSLWSSIPFTGQNSSEQKMPAQMLRVAHGETTMASPPIPNANRGVGIFPRSAISSGVSNVSTSAWHKTNPSVPYVGMSTFGQQAASSAPKPTGIKPGYVFGQRRQGGSRRKAQGHQKNRKWQTRSKLPQKNRKWQTRSKRPQKKSKKNRLNRK